MDVYRSRHKPRPGAISRHVRLSLMPEEWAVFEREAARDEQSMAFTLTSWLVTLAQRIEREQDRIDALAKSSDVKITDWVRQGIAESGR